MNFDIERNIYLNNLHQQAALERMIPRTSLRKMVARVLSHWSHWLKGSEEDKPHG